MGINYAMLNTKTETGVKIDSSGRFSNATAATGNSVDVNGYYRPNQANAASEFTNRYHFIELPVLYQYRLNNNKKLPLYINSGFSISKAVSIDGLVYDKYNNIQYSNNNAYNKTQFGILFGLAARLPLANDVSLIVGPQIQYNLTGLTKNKNWYGNYHLLNYGIQANIQFNKK